MLKLNNKFIKEWMYNKIIKYELIYEKTINNLNLKIFAKKNNYKNKKIILDIIDCINYFNNNFNFNNIVNIYIYLSNFKKLYPKNNKIIDVDNVNSGVCYFFYNKCDIYIWRKEEILKVLIHELLHSLYIDDNFDIIDNLIYKNYNIKKNINSNEIYIETLAELFYFNLFHKNLNKNLHYMKLQCNRLLKYNNFNNLYELLSINSNKIFQQNTSIFSYYIMKTALLNNLDQFINFININGLYFNIKNSISFFTLLNNSFQKLACDLPTINHYYKGNSLKMTI